MTEHSCGIRRPDPRVDPRHAVRRRIIRRLSCLYPRVISADAESERRPQLVTSDVLPPCLHAHTGPDQVRSRRCFREKAPAL